ncbi:hypothetical protein PGTUg99_026703 [Puccinia graminis f. sp. tritici]|uniref:RING-type domain-containing protein n=1 Tax=Puccinia graminis f. sp. tritici TaxID=56615 RepID=A0A5B0QLX8_PUCGR|nr:hypothetical protein PGTUg99_026703 [Puccinia graminis f. sp. tritici]
MDREILELTQTALSHLPPQYYQVFDDLFRAFQAVHYELYSNPLRDRMTTEEAAEFFSSIGQVDYALKHLGKEDLERLEYLFSYWVNVITDLDESRATSFKRRRILVGKRLDTLPIISGPTLKSIPDGETLGCVVCMEELAQSQETIIQLPCHPSHLFHRDCIQRWLEGSLGCPTCRAEVELPPWEGSQ